MSFLELAGIAAVAASLVWRFVLRDRLLVARADPEADTAAAQRQKDLALMREMARKIVRRTEGYDMLPSYDSVLRLDPGEVSHFEGAASLVALRTTRTITTYHGVSGRLRIAKGISYRAGVIESVSTPVEEVRVVDEGIASVTNRRVLFHGTKGTSSIRIDKIVAAYGDEEGFIRLDRENGKPMVMRSPHSVLVFALVQRLLDDRMHGRVTEHRYIDLEAEREKMA